MGKHTKFLNSLISLSDLEVLLEKKNYYEFLIKKDIVNPLRSKNINIDNIVIEKLINLNNDINEDIKIFELINSNSSIKKDDFKNYLITHIKKIKEHHFYQVKNLN